MAIIKKNISFVMQLDGITINDMTSLRENPSSELLQMHQDGRLGRWLRAHNAEEERNKLNELTLTGDQVKDLAAIFEILGIDRDIDDIRSSLFINTGSLIDTKSSEEVINRLNLIYFIQSLFVMKNCLPTNIDFIDKDYISLKISTKDYFNKIKLHKNLTNEIFLQTFFNVKRVGIGKLGQIKYIDKIIRCTFGDENNLRTGEKHIDFPDWDVYRLLNTNGYKHKEYTEKNRIDIYFPIKQTYDPDTVCFILKKICDLAGDIKIKFQQKDTSPQDALHNTVYYKLFGDLNAIKLK